LKKTISLCGKTTPPIVVETQKKSARALREGPFLFKKRRPILSPQGSVPQTQGSVTQPPNQWLKEKFPSPQDYPQKKPRG